MTGDESFFKYYPETKRQSEEWHITQSPQQEVAYMRKQKIPKIISEVLNHLRKRVMQV
jgi:hypothetical protein